MNLFNSRPRRLTAGAFAAAASDPAVKGAITPLVTRAPKLVVAGDSRGAFHLGALLYSVRGPYNWARWKLNQRFEMDPAWITAVAGTQIAVDNGSGISLLSQLPAALALQPGFLAIFSDVNDITNGRTGDQMIADMTSVLTAVLAAGVTPILHTCVVPTIWNATQRAYARRYNGWMRELRADPRIIVIDAAQRVLDWSSATSQPIGSGATGYLYDTTHFSPLSAELIGDDIAAALDPRLPPALWHGMSSPEDSYDAAQTPQGSLLGASGAFLATGGALMDIANNAGSASTGSVAAGCRLYKTNGQSIAVVGAVQSGFVTINGVDVPVKVQNIKVTAGGTGKQQATFSMPDVTANIAPGDVAQMSAWVNVKAATGLYGAGIQLYDMTSGGAVTQNYGDLASWANAGVYSFQQARPKKGFQRSGRMTLSATVARLRPLLLVEVDGATANVEVEIATPAVRKFAA